MTGVLIEGCIIPGSGEASVYCEGGRVQKVVTGGSPDVPGGTVVIQAAGGSLFPGFADTHCHPFEYGASRRSVDLRGTTNMTGVRLRVQARVAASAPGEWVVGRGWDQEAFFDGKMPTRGDIDGVSPSNPVVLTRVCGHIALVNGRALELLGLEGAKGPEYERGADGALTGILKEDALTQVYAAIGSGPGTAAADLQGVEAEAARMGLTSLSCIVSPDRYREELDALVGLSEGGSLSLRYRVYVPTAGVEYVEEKGLRKRLAGERVSIRGVKIFADGSLGARTAALREPYSDDPGNSGMLAMADEALEEAVAKADALGHQVIVHAIGDRAVEQAVGALSKFTGGGNPRRHRVEHASLLPGDLRQKMAKHGIRAAVQPLFVTSDSWRVARLGEERARDLYPFRSMLSEGIVVSGSSDSPVESLSPILGVWAAMARSGANQEEALPWEDAFRLYTSWAASNSFDDETGVKEGAPANLTLLDSGVEGMHPALLRKVGVLATVVNGAPVHYFGAA